MLFLDNYIPITLSEVERNSDESRDFTQSESPEVICSQFSIFRNFSGQYKKPPKELGGFQGLIQTLGAFPQAEKLLPHPQDFTAFGFLNVNPRFSRPL